MSRKRPSKRTLILIGVSLAIILTAGIYTWQSLAAWKGYEARLLAEQSGYKRLENTVLSGTSISQRLQAVTKLDDKLQKRSELCVMNALFSWQSTVLPPLRDGVKRCNDKVKQLDAVAKPLHALRQTLETSQKIQSVLTSLVATESLTEANWTKNGLGSAKRAQESLKAVSTTDDAKELVTQASVLTEALSKSWERLVAANSSKDKAAFLEAFSAVTKAYADFAGLADSFDTQINKQVTGVIDASSAL